MLIIIFVIQSVRPKLYMNLDNQTGDFNCYYNIIPSNDGEEVHDATQETEKDTEKNTDATEDKIKDGDEDEEVKVEEIFDVPLKEHFHLHKVGISFKKIFSRLFLFGGFCGTCIDRDIFLYLRTLT